MPFTWTALPPGNQAAHLQVTLPPTATVGALIPLTLDSTLTQLTTEAGTPATIETVANNRLALVSGSITVIPSVPAMSHLLLLMLAAVLAVAALRFIRS